MSLKRYSGGTWTDINSLKRYNSGAWINAEAKRFENGAWKKIFPTEFVLYDSGNEYSAVTGGWRRTTNFWYPYTTIGTDVYTRWESTYIEVKSFQWYNFPVPITSQSISLTGFSNVNVLFDLFGHETKTYTFGIDFGVTAAIPDYIYRNNPITVFCQGYSHKISMTYRIPYLDSDQWFYNQTASLNISDLSGMYHVFILPISTAWTEDYTILKIKKVWLN